MSKKVEFFQEVFLLIVPEGIEILFYNLCIFMPDLLIVPEGIEIYEKLVVRNLMKAFNRTRRN